MPAGLKLSKTKIVKIIQSGGFLASLLSRLAGPLMKIAVPEGGFLSMLLGTLGASLLGNLLTGKGIVRAGSGNKKGKEIVRAGFGNHSQNKMDF